MGVNLSFRGKSRSSIISFNKLSKTVSPSVVLFLKGSNIEAWSLNLEAMLKIFL